MKEMKKIQGMRCKIFTKIMILLMVCLLASCAEDPYLKTSSTEQEESSNEKNAAADEEASAGEGVSENEGVTKSDGIIEDEVILKEDNSSSDEETGTTGENTVEDTAEPVVVDGKGYIFHAEILEYDAEKIAQYLLGLSGEEYSYTESSDSFTGGAFMRFESGQKRLQFSDHTGMKFETIQVSNLYLDPSVFVAGNRTEMSYQKPHVSNLFPKAPESIEGYEEAEKVCDEAADLIGFPYSARETYYIDYEGLMEYTPKFFGSGGPAWAEGNVDNDPGERTEPYWNEDESAFLFVYRMDSIDHVPLGTLCNENIMTVLYCPKFGIIQISCPDILRITEKEETEIKDADSIDQEFRVTAASIGLMDSDIEIVSKELVYSSYETYWSEGSTKDLRPYWKVSFRGLVSDKELETIMLPFIEFRGEGQSEWYLMFPAVSE